MKIIIYYGEKGMTCKEGRLGTPHHCHIYSSWKKKIIPISLFIISLFFSVVSEASVLTVGSGKKFSNIQSAIKEASCGDRIDIYRGTYQETFVINNKGCSSSNYLTIQAAEPGVVIDGNFRHSLCQVTSYPVYYNAVVCITNSDNLRIGGNGKKIEIKNYGINNPSESFSAVFVGNESENVKIRDLKITTGIGGNGKLEESDSTNINSVFLLNANGLVFENNEINPGINQIDRGISSLFSNNIKIKNNIIKNGMKETVYLVQNDNCLLEKNYVFSNYNTDNRHHFILIRETQNAIIRYNIFELKNSLGVTGGVVIFYDKRNNDAENHKMYNNIVIGDSGTNYGIFFSKEITGVLIKNNIISMPNDKFWIGQDFEVNTGSTTTSENNIITGGNKVYDPNNNLKITERNNFYQSVDYVGSGKKPSPFYLPSDQNAYQVDKGIDIGYTGTDFNGNSVPSGNRVDIGAFEYVSDTQTVNVPPNPPLLLSVD